MAKRPSEHNAYVRCGGHFLAGTKAYEAAPAAKPTVEQIGGRVSVDHMEFMRGWQEARAMHYRNFEAYCGIQKVLGPPASKFPLTPKKRREYLKRAEKLAERWPDFPVRYVKFLFRKHLKETAR